LKTSNDLEVFTIQNPSKNKLEEICDIRQPVLFDYNSEEILETCNFSFIDDTYSAFDIKIRDTKNTDKESEKYIPLLFSEAIKLFQNDEDSKYITENNREFLDETGMVKTYKYNDSFLRPPLVSNCKYDLLCGSKNTTTPLRYNLNYRNFYYVTDGEITLKLIVPNNSKYLYPEKDYENFEFSSPVDVWNVQNKYRADFNKVKVLDLVLKKGSMIYIPAYWWYSIKFNTISSIAVFQYRTYMNTLAIMPDIMMSFLQSQNIKRESIDKLEISEPDNKSSEKID
tara:strand:- start:76 stop:924 length:849 start_codon:yes stop_codon:yes gene_type:complete